METMELAAKTTWITKPIGEVLDVVTGNTPSKSEVANMGDHISFVKPPELQNEVIGEASESLSELGAKAARVVPTGSVLVSCIGNLGRVGLADRPVAFNQQINALKPHRDLEPKYLFYYFQGPSFKEALERAATATTVALVNKGNFEKLPLTYPPLPQQRRIVSAIEAQLGRLDAAVARLHAAKAKLQQYRQAVLTYSTTGNHRRDDGTPLIPVVIGEPAMHEAPKGWKWTLLTDVSKLESGHTPRKTLKEYWEGGDVPWISLQDIRAADGTILMDTKYHPTMMGIDNSSARLLPAGTVVFSRDISVGFVTIMGKVMATTQHFANWICGERLNNRFLMYMLMASRGPLLHQGQGTTVKTIYMTELMQFHVLVPPVAEQVRIVAAIDERLDAMNEMETTLDAELVRSTRLRQVVLKRAFEGRLW